MENTKKISYNYMGFVKGENNTATGVIEGWTFNGKELKTVNVGGKEKNILKLKISSKAYNLSDIEYCFGKEFAETINKNEDGSYSLFVTVTAWENLADRLNNNVDDKMLINVFGTFRVTEFTSQKDNKVYKNLELTARNYKIVNFNNVKKSDIKKAGNTSEQSGFTDMTDDEDLPF